MKEMKFRSILMVMLTMCVCVVFNSCSDKDEDSLNALIGQWQVVEWEGQDNREYEEIYVFKENGVFIRSGRGFKTYEGKYSVSGNKLRLDHYLGRYEIGVFKIKGDNLTFTYDTYDKEKGDENWFVDRITEVWKRR